MSTFHEKILDKCHILGIGSINVFGVKHDNIIQDILLYYFLKKWVCYDEIKGFNEFG